MEGVAEDMDGDSLGLADSDSLGLAEWFGERDLLGLTEGDTLELVLGL